RFPEAVRAWRRALTLHPDNAELHNKGLEKAAENLVLKGRVLAATGRMEEAERFYLRAISLLEDLTTRPRSGEGTLRLRDKEGEIVIRFPLCDLNRASLWFELGRGHCQQGRSGKAREAFRNARAAY